MTPKDIEAYELQFRGGPEEQEQVRSRQVPAAGRPLLSLLPPTGCRAAAACFTPVRWRS